MSSTTYIYPPEGSKDIYENSWGKEYARYPWFPLPNGYVMHLEVRCAICRNGLCTLSLAGKWEGHKYPTLFVGMCPDCVRKVRHDPNWKPEDELNFPDHIKYD